MTVRYRFAILFSCFIATTMAVADGPAGFLPGGRVLVEAHNCYPNHGLWRNRLEHALEAGPPMGIELDLAWYVDAETGAGSLIVSHGPPISGDEPAPCAYFFERIRPIVEAALAEGDNSDWPLFTLNINDIRGRAPEIFEAVWELTGEYAHWLCTAVKGAPPDPPAELDVKPILILAGGGRFETQYFYERVAAGENLRIFGAGQPNADATNFRRWINYPWSAVEPEGQRQATAWDDTKAARLTALVENAHERGYWIRFYALNGHGLTAGLRLGLNPFYNFGSLEAAQIRWTAAHQAGVDFVATDQPRELAALFAAVEEPSATVGEQEK